MSSFYGRRGRSQSNPRASTARSNLHLRSIATIERSDLPVASSVVASEQQEQPFNNTPYKPGMYLQEHPDTPSQPAYSDDEFDFGGNSVPVDSDLPQNVSSTPRSNTDLSHGSSFYNFSNTPSRSADQVFTSSSASGGMAFGETSQTVTPPGTLAIRRENIRSQRYQRNPDGDLWSMIQQQQGTLETLLHNQQAMQRNSLR